MHSHENKAVESGETKRPDPPSEDTESSRRSKRSKYAAVACDECKRRKLKCISRSDSLRCERCLSKSSSCTYSNGRTIDQPLNVKEKRSSVSAEPHDESLGQDVKTLRRQVADLIETVSDLKTRMDLPLDGRRRAASDFTGPYSSPSQRDAQSQRVDVPQQPQFVGPTRSAYSIEIGEQSLNRMGIPSNDPASLSTPPSPILAAQQTTALDSSFWQRCNKEEVVRLIDVFDDEVTSVYPCLDTQDLVASAAEIISWGRSREVDQLETPGGGDASVNDFKNFQMAKVVIATALVLEEHGKNDYSTRMVESAERSVSRILKPTCHLKDVQLLVILSIYYFHCDEDLLAWRAIGIAAREALVLGMHRKESLFAAFSDEKQRSLAMRIFWCIYALDRRWSFGTSLSFALQEDDIDPELPEPNSDYPYLQCMIGYGRLCTIIWKAIMSFGTLVDSIPDETIMFLDMKTQEWLESIPTHLQLRHPRLGLASRAQPRVLHRLRALLYLRGNHIRTLIYRHHLLSSSRVKADLRSAWLVVEIAQDSIQVLVHLNATSDIYRRQQSAFHYFLISAMAVIFLAVCHEPVIFAEPCRKSFHAAVKLVRDFSRGSKASNRLWNSIKGLLPRLRTLAKRVAEENRDPNQPEAGSIDHKRKPSRRSLQRAVPAAAPPPVPAPTSADDNSMFNQMTLDGSSSQQGFGPMAVTTISGGDVDVGTDMSGQVPNMFQMSNDLMAIFDVLEQGQQVPIDFNMNSSYSDSGAYPPNGMMGEPDDISRHFHGLI